MKKYLVVALSAAAAGAAYVVARKRQVPLQPAGAAFEPAPGPSDKTAGRTTEPDRAVDADDLTRVNGIGPVYAARLGELGIERFESLARADADDLGAKLGISARTVSAWQSQADTLAG